METNMVYSQARSNSKYAYIKQERLFQKEHTNTLIVSRGVSLGRRSALFSQMDKKISKNVEICYGKS